jgi:ABC-type transporter Mla subunit MlaD
MGFNVGEITRVEANAPYDPYGVTIFFQIKAPYYGYLWSDSKAKVAGADFLGSRFLEVTKGVLGVPTVFETTNRVAVGLLNQKFLGEQLTELTKLGTNKPSALALLNTRARENESEFYTHITKESYYWLEPDESPALTERLQKVVDQVEEILPVITGKFNLVLDNSVSLTSNLNITVVSAQTVVTNLNGLIADANGLVANLDGVIPDAHLVITNFGGVSATVNSALPELLENINQTLENLSTITSNLNAQVQANTNILESVSRAVTDTDDLVQGLKRHWLLRSAFKKKDP